MNRRTHIVDRRIGAVLTLAGALVTVAAIRQGDGVLWLLALAFLVIGPAYGVDAHLALRWHDRQRDLERSVRMAERFAAAAEAQDVEVGLRRLESMANHPSAR